jgi:hypothetical protein
MLKDKDLVPEPLDRGIRDCLLGKGNSENPYPRGSSEAILWVEGWAETNNFHDYLIQNTEAAGSC